MSLDHMSLGHNCGGTLTASQAASCLKRMLRQCTADGTIISHVFIDIYQRWIEAMRDSICPHPPLLLPNVGRYLTLQV